MKKFEPGPSIHWAQQVLLAGLWDLIFHPSDRVFWEQHTHTLTHSHQHCACAYNQLLSDDRELIRNVPFYNPNVWSYFLNLGQVWSLGLPPLPSAVHTFTSHIYNVHHDNSLPTKFEYFLHCAIFLHNTFTRYSIVSVHSTNLFGLSDDFTEGYK